MTTKSFNPVLINGYAGPMVDVVHINSEGILCGSYNGAEIPEYDEEDIFGNN